MTQEQQRVAIAEWVGPKLFVLHKPIHDPFGYYREDAQGYTGHISEAWKVTEEVARKHVSGRPTDPDRVIAEPAPLPDYCNDLNAIHEAENRLKVDQIGDYENRLYGITDYRDSVKGDAAIFWSQHSLYRNIHATAEQRSEALCRTLFPERFK